MRLILCLLVLTLHLSAAGSLVMLTTSDAQRIKTAIQQKSSASQPFVDHLRKKADADLTKGPWSVTFHRPKTFQLDAHEYYSEAPYFWPDPKNPGKMLRKDGQRNPERFDDNHRDIGAMSTTVLELGTAAYFLDNTKYAAKAAEIIRVWFADPATRMIPNLEHAQAVLGQNDGRPTGIIDTVALIRCVQGMALLQASGKWAPEESAKARKWFADYLNWLMETKKGIAEGNSGNNHMTWYTAQVAAYAAFLGDTVGKQYAYKRFSEALLQEFEPSGAAPKEEARTNSLSYTTFNLEAFATLCRVAQVDDQQLWKTPILQKAMLYAAPFVAHPDQWKHQQIGAFKSEALIFPGLAGAALHNAELLQLHDSLKRGEDIWPALLNEVVRLER